MFKGTPELIEQRRKEIMRVCEELYGTKNFRDITLKVIGEVTDFSRPTIYNYYQSKEEIFLDLFKREYDDWNASLQRVLDKKAISDYAKLSKTLAETLDGRKLLLKLLAVNLYDMEDNSRIELLVDFKKSYAESIRLFKEILKKHGTGLSDEDVDDITITFFEAMHGFYPYANHSEKQMEAMDKVGVGYDNGTEVELARRCLDRLLRD